MASLRTRFAFALTAVVALASIAAPRDAAAAPPKARGQATRGAGESTPKRTASLARTTPRGKKVAPSEAKTPALAAAAPRAATKVKPPCLRESAFVLRGTEEARFALTRCDGTPAPFAIEHLSVLARPDAGSLVPANMATLAKRGAELAPGVRRLDARLVSRLQTIVDHFAHEARDASATLASSAAPKTASKPPARIVLVSGYRPTAKGSYHAHGKALDFRLDGVSNEALVAFCKTLVDTGCGYYPNSSFVHLDVRDAGAGHVTWIDGSGPGESAHYVSAWPPPPSDAPSKPAAAPSDPMRELDSEAPRMPVDEHPSTPHAEQDPESEVALPPLPTFETPAAESEDAPRP